MVLLQIALKNTMGMAVNNTENEKKKNNAFFYLTDCSPYEDLSNRSLTSLLSAMIET